MRVDFRYREFLSTLRVAEISFWLHTKRKDKIYSLEFRQFIEQSKHQNYSFEKLVYHRLRELLIYLDKQLETGYLTEISGNDWKQRKLTKNVWISDKRIN